MIVVRDILLIVLVCAVSVPCFGNRATIKRKKNKWLFPEESVKTINVDDSNQGKDSFVYLLIA
ncbi:MAG: hypothetical protein LBC19_14140 [Tannerella sp.]|jgi:hypothetical protein|nr:hypothetical protein [Tannerella sp.]